MKKEKLKYIIAVIFLVIFTFSIVPKTFQNDTFYIIELGNCIEKNGVDWQDHYSIHDNLEYRYPHWAFDVITNKIYNLFSWTGVYVFAQVLSSIFIIIVFWNLIRKKVNYNLAFFCSLIVAYLMEEGFCARGQVLSYSIFLLEYIVLESFMEKPTFLKALSLFGLSVIMANCHSTAWIMMLILVLPFIGEQVIYAYSFSGINERLIKKYNKKYNKALENRASKDVIEKLENEIKHQEEFKIKNEENKKNREHKIIIEKNNNIKYLWIIFLVLILGALCTPLKLTPIIYVLKTSVGNSMNYINEHLPIMPATSIPFLTYSIIIVAILGWTKSKLKLSDAFLILGLYLMTLSGKRNEFLLIGLTAGIIGKMVDDFIKDNATNEVNEKFQKIVFTVFCICSIVASGYFYYTKWNKDYIPESLFPVKATNYVKENLDYKNIRFYNGYDYGSYLLMEGIPVFLDSRCDLYTPEFNKGVKVFDDYMEMQYGKKSISYLMDKYNLEYAIVKIGSIDNTYMSDDSRYTELYKDKNFAVYQYLK